MGMYYTLVVVVSGIHYCRETAAAAALNSTRINFLPAQNLSRTVNISSQFTQQQRLSGVSAIHRMDDGA